MSCVIEQRDRPDITFEDSLLVAERAFGEAGRKVVLLWSQYNKTYFGGTLKPVPIIYVPASPYGHWIGLCTGSISQRQANRIYLMNKPWDHVRPVLLHEMIHSYLLEQGRDPSHEGQDWCDEIMRLSRNYFGVEFWAGRYTVGKIRTEAGHRKSIRINAPSAEGVASISQLDISSWPQATGIVAPDLVTE